MKFTRILAMMLAMLLLGTMGMTALAETEYPVHETILIDAMDMTAAEWMENEQTRALLAVMLELEMSIYEEEYPLIDMIDIYGIPTIYVGIDNTDPTISIVNCFYFYGGEDGGVVVCGIYIPGYGIFNGFVQDYTSSPAVMMAGVQQEGVISTYYEVAFDDYYTALTDVGAIFDSLE